MTSTLTLPQRLVARLLFELSSLTYGRATPLVLHQEMLQTLGLRRLLRFTVQSAQVMKLLERRFGATDAQFLVGLAAMWNGCGFCGFGHTLTGALLDFRDSGHLHPLHPSAVSELMELPNDDAMVRLAELLCEPRYDRLRTLAARLYELKQGHVEPHTADDRALAAAIAMWDYLTECTIVLGLRMKPEEASVPAHPIGRDTALLARYDQARAAQAAARTS